MDLSNLLVALLRIEDDLELRLNVCICTIF